MASATMPALPLFLMLVVLLLMCFACLVAFVIFDTSNLFFLAAPYRHALVFRGSLSPAA